ncbi:hypothetical protein [Tissierella sp. P1]|nr:hypothetical protein [Tissierella sp. P1]
MNTYKRLFKYVPEKLKRQHSREATFSDLSAKGDGTALHRR